MRVALAAALVVLAPQMPEGCAKMFGKKPPPAPDPVPTTTVATAPSTTTTAPPIWHPPENTTPAPPTSASIEMAKVKAAHDAKNYKQVKALLEKKAKGGKANDEEVRYLTDACTALKDKACLAMVHANYDHSAPLPPNNPASPDFDPMAPP
jgi:hypothetical protein